MNDGIVFQVETTRILQILASEIYDSPLALLRENLQNAYDAVRMRFASSGELKDGGRIDIYVSDQELSITDMVLVWMSLYYERTSGKLVLVVSVQMMHDEQV